MTDVDHALHFLAKKKNPNFVFQNPEHWILLNHIGNDDNLYCLICRFNFGKYSEYDADMTNNHGIMHLKENKLLVFI